MTSGDTRRVITRDNLQICLSKEGGNNMTRLALQRLGEAIAALIVISFLVFGLAELVPGDIAEQIAGLEVGQAGQGVEQELDEFRERLGLNRPFVVRWGEWLLKAATGDFGTSLITGREITPEVMAAFPVSLELTVV